MVRPVSFIQKYLLSAYHVPGVRIKDVQSYSANHPFRPVPAEVLGVGGWGWGRRDGGVLGLRTAHLQEEPSTPATM